MPIRSSGGLVGAIATIAALFALVLASPALVQAQEAVDLELVLSVDASGSVDDDEYALQIGGIAAAFRDPAVTNAIVSGAYRKIAVAMIVWAGGLGRKDITDWWIIRSTADAHAFASFIESRPRTVGGGSTGIGAGIASSIWMIVNNNIAGVRMTVDVSGDGIENSLGTISENYRMFVPEARSIAQARDVAEAVGITINGLAIQTDVKDLAEWYEHHVRLGPESFVMVARDFTDFRRAMRAKLLREIGTGPAVTSLPGTPVAQISR